MTRGADHPDTAGIRTTLDDLSRHRVLDRRERECRILATALGAEEALSGHLAVTLEYGDALSEPTAPDAIARDPEVDEVARLLVRGERPGRAVRVQVSIEEGLLARIDRVTTNRSRFLADAARAALAGAPDGGRR